MSRTVKISEKQFQDQVLQFAQLSGWSCYHTFDSRRSNPGFPDLVLCRPPVIVFAELKSEDGKIRAEQRQWLQVLGKCPGVEARVWRPSDWPEVEQMLTTRTKERS